MTGCPVCPSSAAMFSAGRELHAAIHGHLLGRAPERSLSAAGAGFWRSVRPVLRHVDAAGLTAAELPLRHSQLGYQGVVDCVAPFRWMSAPGGPCWGEGVRWGFVIDSRSQLRFPRHLFLVRLLWRRRYVNLIGIRLGQHFTVPRLEQ